MVKQGRSDSGRFVAKSDQFRKVRTVRLTDLAWEKLGKLSEKKNMTRADFLEWYVSQPESRQLGLFDSSSELENREAISPETRKTGTELAHRLEVSSAALTNWLRYGNFAEKSKEHDPEGIAWARESGTKKYRPVV